MIVSNDRRIIGDRVNKSISNILGWLTAALMGAAGA
jgi:hypothetical protein